MAELQGQKMDPWESLVRLGDGELRVGARDFRVTALACENPGCPCEELTLCFRETSPRPRMAALAFDVSLDLANDAPPTRRGLGPAAERVAAGVCGDLLGPVRASLRGALRDKRQRLGTIGETVREYHRRRQTVPWSHVRAGGRSDDPETWAFLDHHDDGGREWDILDHVCANPTCGCEEVTLTFTSADADDGARFEVRIPLGCGAPHFQDLEGVTLAETRRVFDDWQRATRFDRAAFRARYDAVRAHAQPPRVPALHTVGRREACPCGSGKRYKNCCGRAGR